MTYVSPQTGADADDEQIEAPTASGRERRGVLMMMRALSGFYAGWRLCDRACCRRVRRCTGDPEHDCFETILPLMSDAVNEGGQQLLQGALLQLPFETVLAQHREEVSAVLAWAHVIERAARGGKRSRRPAHSPSSTAPTKPSGSRQKSRMAR